MLCGSTPSIHSYIIFYFVLFTIRTADLAIRVRQHPSTSRRDFGQVFADGPRCKDDLPQLALLSGADCTPWGEFREKAVM